MVDILMGASGGIFGILGALFKHGLEVYQETKKEQQSLLILKETNSHELAMADKNLELIKAESESAFKIQDVKTAGEVEIAGYAALDASYASDKSTYSDSPTNPWLIAVDVVRGVIRPGLTLYFAIALTIFTWMIYKHVPVSFYSNDAFLKDTFYRLIDALIFLSTASVGWYFAARPSQKNSKTGE